MIQIGDIVQIAQGEWTGTYLVIDNSRGAAKRGHLIVRPVCRGHEETRRDIRTSEVTAHWKRNRRLV